MKSCINHWRATLACIAVGVTLFATNLGTLVRGADEDSLAGALKRDQAVLQRQAKERGIPLAVTITPRGTKFPPLADARVPRRLRWFLPAKVSADSKLGQLLTAKEKNTAIALVDGDGAILASLTSDDRVNGSLLTIKEVAGTARAHCLKKLGTPDQTDAEYRTAAESLIRMGAPARELVPLLTHRSPAVKAAVRKALAALPYSGVVIAAWDGLKSTDPDMRTACYQLAAPLSKVPKVPALRFWQEADAADRDAALAKWREAGMVDLGPANADLLEYVEAQLGKQVGDGESPTLAVEALLAADAEAQKLVGMDTVWGREVKKGEKVLAGDIIYMLNVRYTLGNTVVEAARHVEIIRRVVAPGKYEVYEQNADGRKTVGTSTFDFATLRQGTVKIFRPVPR
jgi:hypothetical protein